MPEAISTNTNRYSTGIEMFIIINEDIVKMIMNVQNPINNASALFFTVQLSFFMFFKVISELIIKKFPPYLLKDMKG